MKPRRLLTYIFLFFACLTSFGQVNQVLWGKGKALYANPIATIDSLTYGQLLYGDTLYIIFDRQSKRIVYDTIYQHVPGIVFHDTIYTTDTIYLESGRRIGLFSVGPNQYVTFSQGNLQYTQSTDTWQFANEQWECIGAGNIKEGALADKIDLFGWSGKDSKVPYGVGSSGSNADYAGSFVDWGENIINSDVPNTWRTLSIDEWKYLYHERKNADKLFALGTINGIAGMILLPDDWQLPEGATCQLPTEKGLLWDDNYNGGGYINTNTQANYYQDNIYTLEQWQVMEEAGAVFLPAAGFRDKVNWSQQINDPAAKFVGSYATSTIADKNKYYFMRFMQREVRKYAHSLYRGRSVRLVHDTIVPIPEYVDLGLSVKWATFNVGASKPEDYGDYFAWGETEPKEEYSWATYKWVTSGKLTKYNTTDGKTILDPEDDAAYVNWGDKWRMPTDAERDELVENCTWTWTTQNSVNGYKVTGPNGNSIFLPAGGYKGSGPDYPVGEDGLYWLGNVYKNSFAYLFTIQHEVTPPSTEGKQGTRCFGFMIRPIYDDRPPKRIGVFSVAADKQVSFSQGNLQYTQNTDEWRFAREQYEYIGAENIRDGKLADRIDLFGWSANNTTAPFGVSTSTNAADYAGDFVDWGVNTIQGDAPNTWRTLSADEWEYVFKKRKNASNLYGVAQVAGVNGMIILPDHWEASNGIVFKSGLHSSQVDNYSVYQSFTYDQWLAMENAGAVFLPALGYRDGTNVEKCNTSGYYWSNTTSDEKTAYRMYFYSYFLNPNDVHSIYRGRSVRLVHDTIVPETIPDPCLVVKVNDTLSINMMCVEGGTFTMGDDNISIASPAHQVTISDYYIGQTEVTQTLWKAVMGNIPTGNKNPSYPVGYVTYADCQNFIAKLNNLTGLHFQLPTEAEWEYAAMGGNKSHNYIYSGSNTIDDVAWYDQNSENKLHHVGAKQPNELGIYDMSGNAWEWCADYHGKYTAENQINPQGPATGTDRVLRSGSFRTTADRCTNKHRQARDADYPDSHITLRLVLHDTVPVLPEPEYVDLGLSVKWATFNLGATSPEDYGDYFAWGETEPKEEYTWENYKWCDGTDTHITKYNTSDGKITLELEDDAAHVNWGSNWRMPRKDELKELIDSCQWERATLNDVVGNKITGPNGNSIFIPAAGSYNSFDDQLNSAGTSGWLYSSTKASNTYASEVNMGVGKATQTHCSKCLGLTIRPVYDDIPDPCLVVKVNDTLSINMMCVEGGTMYIGRGDTVNKPTRQRPLRQVTVSDFYLGQTEVTQELWMAIMGENHSLYQCDTCLCHPVDSVSIDEVLLFIERLNSLTGYNFRLPTEAEWEYAARGGVRSKGYAYAGSDNVNEVAWCRVSENQGGTTHPVAQKRPNELGLYDMHGNLWEFVHDKFVDDINIYPSVNPMGPEGMKGSATGCGSAYYSSLGPDKTWGWVGTGGGRSEWFGFRLALSDQDPFAAITIGKYRFHMMYVKGGTFMMGSDAPDAEKDEKPVHEVTLSDYYIGQTEVTQKLWKLVMGNNNNPSANQGDELPVTNISRADCQTFVEKLSELTGLRFRLPTEAEWEYAARGGQRSQGYTYAGSNDLDSVAWHKGNCTQPQDVGQKKPNELGIYDMTGNVYEFCQDWYGPYSAESQDNPTGPTSSTKNLRVCRGGAFVNPSNVQLYCRVTRRGMAWDDNRYAHGGLRIVLDLNPRPTPVTPEPEYVDLGLSVKWATFNVGASKPEDYGEYFAWGETEPKEEYSWATYKWGNGTSAAVLTKYNTQDGKTILEPEDDAAHVHWGNNWRVPTDEEYAELRDLCTWTWTTINNVKGYEVKGPNGNSIFLPTTGYMTDTTLKLPTYGYYWSNSLYDTNLSKSNCNYFSSHPARWGAYLRIMGFAIRPVYDDR